MNGDSQENICNMALQKFQKHLWCAGSTREEGLKWKQRIKHQSVADL